MSFYIDGRGKPVLSHEVARLDADVDDLKAQLSTMRDTLAATLDAVELLTGALRGILVEHRTEISL